MVEKAHEHNRKDIQLNQDSITGREARPQREKVNKISALIDEPLRSLTFQL